MPIKLVGVELEGGWDHKPEGYRYDGSVNLRDDGGYIEWVGEAASKPLPKNQIGTWILQTHPQYANRTCGCHVHMSFDSKLEYAQLMTHAHDLERELLDRLEDWGNEKRIIADSAFWRRIRGENSYCRLGGEPDAQAQATGKWDYRYHVLNFCHKLHGTLECRVLPMFKKETLTVSAVETVIEVVDKFVLAMDKTREHFVVETVLGPIVCKAWKQGYTASLIASPQLKQAAKDLIWGGSYYTHASTATMKKLTWKLLTKNHVQTPVATRDKMKDILGEVKYLYDEFIEVTIRRKENS